MRCYRNLKVSFSFFQQQHLAINRHRELYKFFRLQRMNTKALIIFLSKKLLYRVPQKLLVNQEKLKILIQTLPVSYLSITVTQVYAKVSQLPVYGCQ